MISKEPKVNPAVGVRIKAKNRCTDHQGITDTCWRKFGLPLTTSLLPDCWEKMQMKGCLTCTLLPTAKNNPKPILEFFCNIISGRFQHVSCLNILMNFALIEKPNRISECDFSLVELQIYSRTVDLILWIWICSPDSYVLIQVKRKNTAAFCLLAYRVWLTMGRVQMKRSIKRNIELCRAGRLDPQADPPVTIREIAGIQIRHSG